MPVRKNLQTILPLIVRSYFAVPQAKTQKGKHQPVDEAVLKILSPQIQYYQTLIKEKQDNHKFVENYQDAQWQKRFFKDFTQVQI